LTLGKILIWELECVSLFGGIFIIGGLAFSQEYTNTAVKSGFSVM